MFLAANLDSSRLGKPEGSETGLSVAVMGKQHSFSIANFLSFFIFLLEELFLLQGSLPAPRVLPLIYHCQLTESAAIGSSKITFTHRQPQWLSPKAATPELSLSFFFQPHCFFHRLQSG